MKQYIDKSAVITEIERIMDSENENINSFEQHRNTSEKQRYSARMALLEHILSFLDTLEVKEVDLEKEIKNGIDNLSNLHCYMEDLFNGNEEEGVYPIPEKVTNELFEFAKHFFELGLKTKGE